LNQVQHRQALQGWCAFSTVFSPTEEPFFLAWKNCQKISGFFFCFLFHSACLFAAIGTDKRQV
jgi:hypothetical protein